MNSESFERSAKYTLYVIRTRNNEKNESSGESEEGKREKEQIQPTTMKERISLFIAIKNDINFNDEHKTYSIHNNLSLLALTCRKNAKGIATAAHIYFPDDVWNCFFIYVYYFLQPSTVSVCIIFGDKTQESRIHFRTANEHWANTREIFTRSPKSVYDSIRSVLNENNISKSLCMRVTIITVENIIFVENYADWKKKLEEIFREDIPQNIFSHSFYSFFAPERTLVYEIAEATYAKAEYKM